MGAGAGRDGKVRMVAYYRAYFRLRPRSMQSQTQVLPPHAVQHRSNYRCVTGWVGQGGAGIMGIIWGSKTGLFNERGHCGVVL